jgi:hypothetical protein
LRTVPRLALQLEIRGYKDFTMTFRTQKKKNERNLGARDFFFPPTQDFRAAENSFRTQVAYQNDEDGKSQLIEALTCAYQHC